MIFMLLLILIYWFGLSVIGVLIIFFKWREFIKIEYSLFYIFMVFFVYDFDIF